MDGQVNEQATRRAGGAPGDRRSARAERTRERVLTAARDLFTACGYAATSIEAIAAAADVSVETIYKRFRNKRNMLLAVLEGLVVPGASPEEFVTRFLAVPELDLVRSMASQQDQVRALAAFSRSVLQRAAPLHTILQAAAAADPELAAVLHADHQARLRAQRRLIDILASRGPLREGLTADEAAATYSALANPELYTLVTTAHGWSPDRYETWLADTLTPLLLPPA
ncbi:MAG TPA: helix-turn-helix domain-containing protein [Trebonia sp.]